MRAALRAVDADLLVARALAGARPDGAVRILAAGKAAVPMALAATRILGSSLRGGLVVAPEEGQPEDRTRMAGRSVDLLTAGHPVPTAASEDAGRRALELAGSLTHDESLLVLLSGGASALMAVPAPGITLEDKQRTTGSLLRAGADILALNTVRKHLSAIKGGWLAAAAGAPSRTLAISDVVGDDLSVIGSGPTVPDRSTFADALAVLGRCGGVSAFPGSVADRLTRGARGELAETPKPGDPKLSQARAQVIGRRHDAMRGATEEAARRGYRAITVDAPVVGEARVAAVAHLAIVAATAASRPACFVSSGETTVTVTGDGRGGRNQEFALAALEPLAALGPAALASVGTDGVDGPTDAAGAAIDSASAERAARAGLDADAFLSANDAYAFLARTGELLRTGPTGTNVGDLQVVLLV